MCFALVTQKYSFGSNFASQVITLRGVFEGRFAKNTICFSRGMLRKGGEERAAHRVLLSYRSQNPKC